MQGLRRTSDTRKASDSLANLTVSARGVRLVGSEENKSSSAGGKKVASSVVAATKRAATLVQNSENDKDSTEQIETRAQDFLSQKVTNTAKAAGKTVAREASKASVSTAKLSGKVLKKGTEKARSSIAAPRRSTFALKTTKKTKAVKTVTESAATVTRSAAAISRSATAVTSAIKAIVATVTALATSATPLLAIIAAIMAILIPLVAIIGWLLPGTTAERTYVNGAVFPVGVAPGPWGGYQNGRIPNDQLTQVSWTVGHYLRPDAAIAFSALNEKYKEKFGTNIGLTDSYRDFPSQISTRNMWCARGRCEMAAVPGTSNHGWALAVDLGGGINQFGTPQHVWMQENGPSFGWRHPEWAKQGGGKEEAWHWEFWGWTASGTAQPTGDAQSYAHAQMEAVFGVLPDQGAQFTCLKTLWTNESGWNHLAENPSSGAYGIPQSLPANKMASAGSDWRTNYRTQVDWGLKYIKDRYGTPCQAWDFWQSKDPHWY